MFNLVSGSSKFIIFATSFLIASPSSALVNGEKLGEVLEIDKTISIASEYIGGCIFTGLGATIEYWYVISSKACTNEIGDAWGKTAKLDKLLKGGNGFSIRTACVSSGTSIHCKDKPKYAPFDHVGRCIMPVKRTSGYSGVFCIEGLPNKEADLLLRSMVK